MASSPVVSEAPVIPDAAPAKMPLASLIVAMVVAVFVSVALLGGAIFYVVHTGKLSLLKPVGTEGKPAAIAVVPPSHIMALEPMVANLADAGGAAYLKVALTLRIADETIKKGSAAKEEKPGKGITDAEAAVRDTVLTVVGQQTSDQLLAPGGKEQLKSALKVALAGHNPELKVMDLYFIDFLVQR